MSQFSKTALDFARRVSEAYAGDHAAAERDTDQEVVRKVRLWEVATGRDPADWDVIPIYEDRESNDLFVWTPQGRPN